MLAAGYGAVSVIRNGIMALILGTVALTTSVFAEPVTVVALGDSLTAGYGLEPQLGFVPQMEAWLKAQGADVVVQNAGVSGDTTAGGLARVAWALGPDVDALIVTLGGNDMLRGLDPAGSRANLDGILKEAEARSLPVLLVAMQAPPNFGPDYKAAFDAIYPELSTQYGVLLADSFFAGLIAAGADAANPATYAPYMQADGIHPNAEGVKLIVDGLGPEVMKLLDEVKNQPVNQ
jgi:acyl-CoA thioesterase I